MCTATKSSCTYITGFKGKGQLWSCDCIVKETLWNRSEKVDHLASARFWNHQNDKKFGPFFVKLQALYTERCIWDYPISLTDHERNKFTKYMN